MRLSRVAAFGVIASLAVAGCGAGAHRSVSAGGTTTAPAPPPPGSTTTAPGPLPPGGSTSTAPAPPPGGSTTTTTSRPPAAGIYGTVTAGPTCPVERAGQPCPPRPVSGQVQAQTSAGRIAASAPTDAAGNYTLAVPPGSYRVVVVTPSAFPRCPQTDATVGPGGPTRIDISCDTGIR